MPVSGDQNVQGTLHVDRYLTNFSVNFVQDAKNFVAQKATSLITVQKQSDLYVTYDRGYFWRDEAAPRPLGGRPVQVNYKVNNQTYTAIEYALEHVVDDRQRSNVDDPIRLDENATTLLSGKHMIKQDRYWAQNFFKTGVWTNDVIGSDSPTVGAHGILKFSDAGSTPISAIDTWKDTIHASTGYMPNTLVLGAKVKTVLRSHPDIADRIKYTQIGLADEDLLGRLFEIDKVTVARSIYNSANEGAANNFSYIADTKSMWLGFIDPNPTIDSPTAIAMFAWVGLLPGVTNAIGGVIERGRDERAHSDYFQDRMAWDMQVVSADLGTFFSGVVS